MKQIVVSMSMMFALMLFTMPTWAAHQPLSIIKAAMVTGPRAAESTVFTVTTATKNATHPYFGQGSGQGYVINGVQGKELTLQRGMTYTFVMSDVSVIHPFYVSTSEVGNGSGVYSDSVTGNFVIGNGVLTFAPNANTPNLLYYQCQYHAYMGGKINIVDAPEVVATNLANPRGLTFGADGALYVAEAGRGGDGACIAGAEGETCYGTSGGVTQIKQGVPTRVITGMASLGLKGVGNNAVGPHDVTFDAAGQLMVLVGLGNNPNSRNVTSTLGAASLNFGQLAQGQTDKSWVNVLDISAHEAAHNPDGTSVDSNPYAIAAVADGYVVADAGANALFKVKAADKTISTVAVFTLTRLIEFPPGSGNKIPMQAVPTSVTVGPDGAYYVGELTGFPFPVGGANVYRVVPGQAPEIYRSGFTHIMDLAFAPDGTLYVLELDIDSLLGPGTTGAIIRVATNGTKSVFASPGLTAPSALAIGADNKIYVSNFGTSPGGGQVVRFSLIKQKLYLPLVVKP